MERASSPIANAWPHRAVCTALRRAITPAAGPPPRAERQALEEALALLAALVEVYRARGLPDPAAYRAVWAPFLAELLEPAPAGAAPRCHLAARLRGSLTEPAALRVALARQLPARLRPSDAHDSPVVAWVEELPEEYADIPF